MPCSFKAPLLAEHLYGQGKESTAALHRWPGRQLSERQTQRTPMHHSAVLFAKQGCDGGVTPSFGTMSREQQMGTFFKVPKTETGASATP
ncbi:hypothetical protein Y1Q_0001122 [Alligator mississippiensis]|uniref:Uncharacterized protein n=1 Tax=Alligator mississippiensis TaxID=8496 RepID=A0A151M3W2_ALLMI|nr:hypothetical protein Y1Q_0001122 [Alligator mississippiensis]